MSKKQPVIVVGTGGLAREFHAWFGDQVDILGFSADRDDDPVAALLPGKRYDNSVTPDQAGTNQCVVAVSTPHMKRRLHQLLSEAGWEFPTLIHPTAAVAASAQLAPGVIVSPRSVIGSNASIGALSYVNFQVGIGHDAQVGNYVQLNPGSQIGGAALIEDEVLIGSNSAVLQSVRIGRGATVALGAVCFRHVRPETTVIGNPARTLQLG